MKLPQWVRKPQGIVSHSHTVYMAAAKLLEIDAKFYNRVGNRDGARALVKAAAAFRQIGGNAAPPDVAFGWPEDEPAAKPDSGS